MFMILFSISDVIISMLLVTFSGIPFFIVGVRFQSDDICNKYFSVTLKI